MESSYRYMRIIVMYDLPNNNSTENKEYLKFNKLLIKNGFIRMQFSVYSKCVNSYSKVKPEIQKLKSFIPTQGNIRIISVTEKQYEDMVFLCGENTIEEKINGKERFVKIKD